MTETDPLLRPPTGPCVVIDGKSLCHLDHDSTQLSFVRLEIAITQISEMLAPIAGGALRVWVDASLRPNLSARDQQRFDQAKASRRILEGPSGIELDPVFLEWAHKHRALVVSKDRFRTHIQRFPFLNQPGRTFAPAFYDDDQHWVFIEREAPKSRAPQPLSDAINQLARTMSPHPHRANPPDTDVGLEPRPGVRPPEEKRPGPQPDSVTAAALANRLGYPLELVLTTGRFLSPQLTWTPDTAVGPVLAGLVAEALERSRDQSPPVRPAVERSTAVVTRRPPSARLLPERLRQTAGRTVGADARTPPKALVVLTPHSAAQWLPDPTGRFERRYWSGSGWTSRVTSKGRELHDRPPGAPPGHNHFNGAGWYADPSRFHELRWWTGRVWSRHVADGNEIGIDPVPNVTEAEEQPRFAAGWYKDPSGRFELRYWDSSQWTDHVSSAGQAHRDPPIA